MPGVERGIKKHVVKLSAEERSELESVLRRRLVAGWKVRRAQALLALDQGEGGPAWTDERVAQAYRRTPRSVERWRRAAAEDGPLSLVERKAADWAARVRALVDHPRYVSAERLTLVGDSLDTHALASPYAAFAPEEARRVARRLDLVHTPKHGSGLNVAECELSALTGQGLDRHVPSTEEVDRECRAWAGRRNREQAGVDWHFTTADARTRLKRLYPSILP